MKTLLLAGLVTTLLAVSTAFAEDPQLKQPVKGAEGPDIRHVLTQPATHLGGQPGTAIR